MTKEERQRLAQDILNNPVYQEVWDALERKAIDKWKTSGLHDMDTREECFRLYSTLQAHKALLSKVILGRQVTILPTRRQVRRKQAAENTQKS